MKSCAATNAVIHAVESSGAYMGHATRALLVACGARQPQRRRPSYDDPWCCSWPSTFNGMHIGDYSVPVEHFQARSTFRPWSSLNLLPARSQIDGFYRQSTKLRGRAGQQSRNNKSDEQHRNFIELSSSRASRGGSIKAFCRALCAHGISQRTVAGTSALRELPSIWVVYQIAVV
jgi:hypothetical protein